MTAPDRNPDPADPAALVAAESSAGERAPLPDLPTPGDDRPGEPSGAIGSPSAESSSVEPAPAESPATQSPTTVSPTEPAAARPSGDAALQAAQARAATTRVFNIGDTPPLPIPPDTANVRLGAEIDPRCLALLPLVGVWRGEGVYGNEPGRREPQFGQQITISHDGRGFLAYDSVSWTLDPEGPRPGPREVGFFRPQPDGSVQLLIAHAEGRIEVFYGQSRSVASWALSTDSVWRADGPPVVGATRLYGITPDGRLAYVEERAHTDEPLAPHSSAALERLAG